MRIHHACKIEIAINGSGCGACCQTRRKEKAELKGASKSMVDTMSEGSFANRHRSSKGEKPQHAARSRRLNGFAGRPRPHEKMSLQLRDQADYHIGSLFAEWLLLCGCLTNRDYPMVVAPVRCLSAVVASTTHQSDQPRLFEVTYAIHSSIGFGCFRNDAIRSDAFRQLEAFEVVDACGHEPWVRRRSA